MSFPNVIYGDYGDEKRAQSTKIGSMPVGVVMVLPDGREYVHGRASTAAALSAGYICCGSVTVASGTSIEFGLVAATAAVGATSVVVTLAAGTAVTKDKFAEGYLVTASSAGVAGEGIIYKIKANNSAAAGATCTVSLYEEDPIHTAIPGGTITVGLRQNLLTNITVTPAATSLPGPLVGVPQVAISAGFYTWFQRKGYSSAYVATATAMVTGDQCIASTGYAGAFGVVAATSLTWSSRSRFLGTVMGVANTTGFTVVDLNLD